jgi:hypothetical protein
MAPAVLEQVALTSQGSKHVPILTLKGVLRHGAADSFASGTQASKVMSRLEFRQRETVGDFGPASVKDTQPFCCQDPVFSILRAVVRAPSVFDEYPAEFAAGFLP